MVLPVDRVHAHEQVAEDDAAGGDREAVAM